MIVWNPWHGCHKISEGCQHCYMFRRDEQFGKDSTIVTQTKDFHLPVMRNRSRVYRLTSLDNPIYVCLTSDFFIEEADPWRQTVWDMMRYRSDLHFKIITKRIHRFNECLPKDTIRCYDNVTLVCTCENQRTADERLPILLSVNALHKEIIHEPMLERIDIEPYLASGCIEAVTCGGESGDNARLCDYEWILHTREQCVRHGVAFHFKQTGAKFRKGNRLFHIDRSLQQSQARKADIDFTPVDEQEQTNPYDRVLAILSRSSYMQAITLPPAMKAYCRDKGMERIQHQAYRFVRENLAPAFIRNDGAQTPKSGHPVFIAQHATATCSRKRLYKWHDIALGRKLTEKEIIYVVGVIMAWLRQQLAQEDAPSSDTSGTVTVLPADTASEPDSGENR